MNVLVRFSDLARISARSQRLMGLWRREKREKKGKVRRLVSEEMSRVLEKLGSQNERWHGSRWMTLISGAGFLGIKGKEKDLNGIKLEPLYHLNPTVEIKY